MPGDRHHLRARLEVKDLDTSSVHVRRLRLRESISRLYALDLDVFVEDGAVDLDAATGAEATLVITDLHGEERRRVHGMIVEVRDRLDPEIEHRTYGLTIAPRAHRLDMVQTQEVFLDRKVPEIIAAKLQATGLGGAVALRLGASYAAREQTMQYKETDLAFVSRLAEHLGVSFFFEQGDEGDVIVFTDDNGGFTLAEGAGDVRRARRARGRVRARAGAARHPELLCRD